jgi:hypothetical protein
VTVLKKGVRFTSQDSGSPMSEDEVPYIIENLTPTGTRRAAIVGLVYLQRRGYTLNKTLELLGDKPEEKQ